MMMTTEYTIADKQREEREEREGREEGEEEKTHHHHQRQQQEQQQANHIHKINEELVDTIVRLLKAEEALLMNIYSMDRPDAVGDRLWERVGFGLTRGGLDRGIEGMTRIGRKEVKEGGLGKEARTGVVGKLLGLHLLSIGEE